jgi:small-conductance mechanosensitive channel
VYVPNSIMFGEVLTNRSHFRTRRLDVAVTDKERTVAEVDAVVQRTLAEIPDARKPVAQPRIVSITPEGVVVHYSFLVQANLTVDREIMLSLATALDGASIEVIET